MSQFGVEKHILEAFCNLLNSSTFLFVLKLIDDVVDLNSERLKYMQFINLIFFSYSLLLVLDSRNILVFMCHWIHANQFDLLEFNVNSFIKVIEIPQVAALLSGGGYATKAVAHEDLCLPIPRGITTSDAASLPEVCCNLILSIFTYPGMANDTPRKEPLRLLVSKSKKYFERKRKQEKTLSQKST